MNGDLECLKRERELGREIGVWRFKNEYDKRFIMRLNFIKTSKEGKICWKKGRATEERRQASNYIRFTYKYGKLLIYI